MADDDAARYQKDKGGFADHKSRRPPRRERPCRRLLTTGCVLLALAGIFFSASRAFAFRTPESLARFEQQLKAAIARVRPAVVKISALNAHPHAAPNAGGAHGTPTVPYRSIGTGVIVDKRGYVLTNAHVVGEASSVRVRLWRTPPADLTGRVVHTSKQEDLAVVRLQGKGPFPRAAFSNSIPIRVGDWTIAIGSPYGLQHSVSLGIVSDRLSSLWINGHQYRDLIQTDAAINQGNSGGPLINMQGEVVGISTAIYAPSGAFAGIGFAIPMDAAHDYLNSVLPGRGLGLLAAAAFEKEPIPAGAPPPHPAAGKCSACHIIQPPVAGKPIASNVRTVAALVPAGPVPDAFTTRPAPPFFFPVPRPDQTVSRNERDWHAIQRGAALVFATAVLFNMLGLGGGYLYVPMLLLLGIGFHLASATSLFIIAAAHLSALHVFLRSRLIDYKLALVLGPLTAMGAFMGGLSSGMFGEVPLSAMFGCVLALAAYVMQRNPAELRPIPVSVAPGWTWQHTFGGRAIAIDLPVGLPVVFAVGFTGGLLGFAGGVITIPMMVLLFGVPIKVAIATSSLMVSVTSLVGCIGHGIAGHFDPLLSVALALAAVAGAQFGARLTIKADHLLLKRIFSVVLLVIAIWMVGRVV